jgi:YHS domain-containing protein
VHRNFSADDRDPVARKEKGVKQRVSRAALGLLAAFAAVSFVAAADQEPVAGGYCPVAYVKMHKAVKGDPQHRSQKDGRVYHFANAQAKQMFDAEPAKYRIAYDGWCATGVAMGKKIASNPELFTEKDGVTYLFSSEQAKAMFDKDASATIARADTGWSKIGK